MIETLVRFAVCCLLMHGHRTERQQPQRAGEYGAVVRARLHRQQTHSEAACVCNEHYATSADAGAASCGVACSIFR